MLFTQPLRRALARLASSALVAGTIAVGTVGYVASTAEPASAAAPLQCDQNTLYATNGAGDMVAINIATHATTPVGSVAPTNNGLGISEQGVAAYSFQNGGRTLARYDAVTGEVTTYPNVLPTNTTVIRGAINPATGVFYYGANGSSAPLYAWNTESNTDIGRVGDITGLTDQNGDFAFSSRGLLFVVTGNEVRRVNQETVPATAGSVQLTTSLVATLPSGTNSPGIAFSSDGYLYVSSGATIIKLDPASGARLDSWTIGDGSFTPSDLASCNYPNTITVRKNVVGRAQAGDQFNLSVTGGQIQSGNTATTSGTQNGVQAAKAGASLTIPQRVYTVRETAAGTTDLSDYTSTWECVNVNNGQVLAQGDGAQGEFTFPAAVSDKGTDVDCTFTNTPLTSSLTLDKSVQPTTVNAVGQQLTYTFVIKNTGELPLSDVGVNETTFTGTGGTPIADCPASTLAPGATVTCTATYAVTQADLDAGAVDNTAKAVGQVRSGASVESEPSSAKVVAQTTPGISLIKTVDRAKLVAGQTATYTLIATNTGDVTLNNVSIAEEEFTGSGSLSGLTCLPAQPARLAPRGTLTCTASYTVTQDDIDNGQLRNRAKVTGTSPSGTPVSDTAEVNLPGDRQPGLTLVKRVGNVADVDADGVTDVGDTIDYVFDVTNIGNTTIKDIEVSDPMLAAAGISVTCSPTSLAPGSMVTCRASKAYTITQADVDAGAVDNTATVTGTPPSGTQLPKVPPSSTTTPTYADPDIELVKSVDRAKLVAGQTATYTLVATNTGNVTLHDVTIDEGDFTGSGSLSALSCSPAQPATLAPNETVECEATYVVTQADVDAGSVRNTATATGTPPAGEEVSDDDEVELTSDRAPGLQLVKRVDEVTDVDADGATDAGDTIAYVFEVTNTGNTTITDIAVSDPMLTAAGITVKCSPSTLAPGAKVTCTTDRDYTITQADTDAGSVDNTATVTGTPPAGTNLPNVPPSSTDTPTDAEPAIELVKTVDRAKLVAGQTATYTLVATNTGNVTLRDVSVAEGDFTGTGALSDLSCTPEQPARLAPGEAVTCQATYVVTQADIDEGRLHNSATATGTPPTGRPVSDSDEVDLPGDRTPGLTFVKRVDAVTDVDGDGATDAGDTIAYVFDVTNVGNTTITDIAVSDPLLTTRGIAITCPATTVAPRETVTCTATGVYTITQADVDAGRVVNTATVTGTPPAGTDLPDVPPSSTTTETGAKPAIDLLKTVDRAKLVVGETATYTLVATNAGNVTLHDVTVEEGDFTGSGKLSALTCAPQLPATLAPTEAVTCTATYTVTQDDLDRGSLRNRATATGTPPAGTPVTDADEVDVTGDRKPGLSLAKRVGKVADANHDGVTDVGDTISYLFDVTNIGNTTVTDVAVDDPMLAAAGIAVTCPSTTLAPGAKVTCTSEKPYTITERDARRGQIRNVATVSGDSAGDHGTGEGGDGGDGGDNGGTAGHPAASAPSAVEVPVEEAPAAVEPTKPGPSGPLPNLGGPTLALGLGGGLLVLVGGALLIASRRRTHRADAA